MVTVEIKKRIHKLMDHADERVLQMIYAMLKQDDKTIVAYTVDGKPLTRSQYIKRLEESEKDIEKGNYISQNDLEKEMESW